MTSRPRRRGTHPSNHADAEDAAQCALLKVFARASDFDRERDALAWTVGIASYECMMMGVEAPIVIGGLPIPSSAPAFLAVLALHVPAGLGATIAGAWAMLAKKGSERHSRSGSTYYLLLATVAMTMAGLAAMRWTEDKELFVLGTLSIAAASVGRLAMRRRWRGFVPLHVMGMGCSYILMLTAFYVDNGKNLPVWKRLPPLSYWLIPGLVGAPLIVRALLKYRRVPL